VDEVDPAVIAERRAVRAEQAEQELLERMRDAERRVEAAGEKVAAAEQRAQAAERQREQAERAAHDLRRQLQAAEQREFAEQQRRIETEEELSGGLGEARTEAARLAESAAAADQRAAELARDAERRDAAIDALVRRAEAAEQRVAHLESLVPREPPAMTRQETAPAGKSTATGSAIRVPSSAPKPADMSADLDAAAERLRSETPPPEDSEDTEQPEGKRGRGLLRRRR
jgi:chromosome segregation ATPase